MGPQAQKEFDTIENNIEVKTCYYQDAEGNEKKEFTRKEVDVLAQATFNNPLVFKDFKV